MKKRSVIILIAGIAIFAGIVVGWLITSLNTQREWPSKQLRNAVTLGLALSSYREIHGSYPTQLEDLVAGGTLDQEEFERLQFRPAPRADSENWLYKTPDQLTDIAIVGPTSIFPWSGHSGYTVTARADGGGELILGTKRYRIPSWATK